MSSKNRGVRSLQMSRMCGAVFKIKGSEVRASGWGARDRKSALAAVTQTAADL